MNTGGGRRLPSRAKTKWGTLGNGEGGEIYEGGHDLEGEGLSFSIRWSEALGDAVCLFLEFRLHQPIIGTRKWDNGIVMGSGVKVDILF
jgi:hypothetical protein